MKPTPVITTRGLCYAVNAKQITGVFDGSQYMDDFQKAFSIEDGEQLLSGHQSMSLNVDLPLSFLTDRTATSGTIW